ncbi:MAG: acyl-CoA thioesterase [Planctomycetes bacterium]|nr:acyl-CoA thioesterase [Planctomycetota bacterium]
MPFRTTRLVEFHDTDMAGIMHFAAFYRYMASAEHELFRSLGMSLCPLDERGSRDDQSLTFPRVSASCDFKSPARCEEVLDIEVRLVKLGKKSLTFHFEFTHEGREVASGQMTSVCCHVNPSEPLKSVSIPAEMVEKLQPFLT